MMQILFDESFISRVYILELESFPAIYYKNWEL